MSCLFCGGTPMTKEHVLGRAWIRSLFPSEEPFEARNYRAQGGQPYDISSFHTKETGLLSIRLACATCNNGWMQELDLRAQPLVEPLAVDGRGRIDSLADIVALAAWATKVGVCLATIVLHEKEHRPEAEALRLNGMPAPGTTIWLAPCHDEFPQLWLYPCQLSSPDLVKRGVEGWSSTFKIKNVAVQVLYLPPALEVVGEPGAGRVRNLVQLWPHEFGSVDFPRADTEILGQVDVLTFARAFVGNYAETAASQSHPPLADAANFRV
jgi:hypothetical protein